MNLLPQHANGCPFLILAPMEGVGDQCFRKAIASIGGFDEAVRDFLRVPKNAHVKSLAVVYDANELSPIPLAAQLMGSDLDLMADMAIEMQNRGAHRIDLNCGCPSNTVTGRGAGSSLLKEPNFLYQVAKAMVEAVSVPVTIKMRTGYEDTSLFKENILAAQESGAKYITLHPRTKVDGYGPPAKWEYIALAKSLLHIPVVGNGDILAVEDALNMLKQTKCDALMIGRGSLINPFLFHEIKAYFSNTSYHPTEEDLKTYFHNYLLAMPEGIPFKTRVNKLKQLMGYFFKRNESLIAKRSTMLIAQHNNPEDFLSFSFDLLTDCWEEKHANI